MDFYHSLQMASQKVDFQPTATEMTFHRKKLNQSILKSKMEYQSLGVIHLNWSSATSR